MLMTYSLDISLEYCFKYVKIPLMVDLDGNFMYHDSNLK